MKCAICGFDDLGAGDSAHACGTSFFMKSATPPSPSTAPAHFYTFTKPAGWINLAKPGQSWDEWTKEQGLPTPHGWKVFGTAPTVEVDERNSPWYQAACKMGNILYNLAQIDDLPDSWKKNCREAVSNWDASRAALASKPPAREAAERQSIDTPEFRALEAEFVRATIELSGKDHHADNAELFAARRALIANIDTWGGAK